MPLVSNEANSQYWEPFANGPVAIADLSSTQAPPATIVASGNYISPVMPGDGFKVMSATVTSSQAGAISIQRYFDQAGTIPQGAPVSTTLVAATPAVVTVNDGLPYRTFTYKITNTGGSTANLTNFGLLLQAS